MTREMGKKDTIVHAVGLFTSLLPRISSSFGWSMVWHAFNFLLAYSRSLYNCSMDKIKCPARIKSRRRCWCLFSLFD